MLTEGALHPFHTWSSLCQSRRVRLRPWTQLCRVFCRSGGNLWENNRGYVIGVIIDMELHCGKCRIRRIKAWLAQPLLLWFWPFFLQSVSLESPNRKCNTKPLEWPFNFSSIPLTNSSGTSVAVYAWLPVYFLICWHVYVFIYPNKWRV